MRLGRLEINKTSFGWDMSVNHKTGPGQHFAAWYLRRCDFGFYIFGKHFVWSLEA
jgi:hypothetical protein